MEITLSHAGRPVSDYLLLVDAYGEAELASPLRSTVPLLAYWRDPAVALSRFGRGLVLETNGDTRLSFEHSVRVRRGRGKPSFTDLMLLTDGVAVGVEAKATEPAYKTVDGWLGASPSTNRKDVLGGWLELIGEATGRRLTSEDVGGCSYQLIHRTASVCSLDAARRLVVYHCFDTSQRMLAYYREQLSRLRTLLGALSALEFWLIRTTLGRSANYSALVTAWQSAPADRPESTHFVSEVRTGLRGGLLLSVEEDTWERV